MPIVKQHVKRWRAYLKSVGYPRSEIRVIANSHILREFENRSTPPRTVVIRYVNTDTDYNYFGCEKYCSPNQYSPNIKRQLRRLIRRLGREDNKNLSGNNL